MFHKLHKVYVSLFTYAIYAKAYLVSKVGLLMCIYITENINVRKLNWEKRY